MSWAQKKESLCPVRIDSKAQAVAREREDARAAVEVERRRVIGQIADHMIPILQSYAKDHGYSLVLDSGQQDGPIIVALNDITREIVSIFDRALPAN